jgi:hypothetical protein
MILRGLVALMRASLLVVAPFVAVDSFGQECDCPAITECGVCSGGITSFTLQYNGVTTELITVSDQVATVFSSTVSPGEYFLFNSPTRAKNSPGL